MFQQIEEHLHKHMEKHSVPAFALALIKDSKIVYLNGFGKTGVEDYALPVSSDTLFCIGSVTKTLTGTLVMRLVEKGLLDLDAPIKQYLPWLKLTFENAEQLITLRHLLSHTSGLPSAYTDFGPRDLRGLGDYIRQEIPYCQFVAAPGRVYFYSNAGLDLAGYIAEVVTGKFYPTLVRDEVFLPLQMQRSTFDRNEALTYPMALPHQLTPDGKMQVEHRMVDNTPGNPAGFGISTIHDLANLALMFLNHGQFNATQFLSPASIAEMHRPQTDVYNVPTQRKYGITFFTDQYYKSKRLVLTGGSMMSYACRIILLPDENSALVAITNWSNAFWTLTNELLDLAFNIIGSPRDLPIITSDNTARYVGEYLNPENGLVTITLEDNQLILQFLEGSRLIVNAVEGGHFFAFEERISVAFLTDSQGNIEFVMVNEQPYQRIQRDAAKQVDVAVLEKYTGCYATIADFVGAHYSLEFRVEDDQLVVYQEKIRAQCLPLSDNAFVSKFGVFEFQENGVQVYNSIVKQKI